MQTKTKTALVLAYALHTVFILLLASVPPVSRDALTHHLAVPKLWLEKGLLVDTPDILFSYYPQLLDLLYTLPLALGNDIVPKYLHFSFALLTALIIVLFVRRRTGPVWAALAGLLFLTVPLIVKLSVTAYVDLGLIFFTTAALFSAVIWLDDTTRLRWLVLAGVCSGLALGTKYNALVSFVVLGLLLPFFFLRGRRDKHAEQLNAVKYGAIFAALSLLLFAPWLARNAWLTGDPLYPLAQGLFRQTLSASVTPAEATDAMQHAVAVIREAPQARPQPLGPLLTRKLVYEESLPYTLLIPLRVFFQGEDDDPGKFDGRLNPMLLLLPLALLLLARRSNFQHREVPLFAYFSLLVILLVFLTKDMRVRWIATVIPPLVVLATYGLFLLHRRLVQLRPGSRLAVAVSGLLIAGYMLPNLTYALALYQKIDPVPYVAGRIDYAGYAQKHRPEYAAIELANAVVPPDRYVLGLYLGHRRYYFSANAIVVNEVFTNIATDAASGDAIAERLLDLGYTHLVVRDDLFRQWLAMTDAAVQARVHDFALDCLRQLELREGYGLYQIVSPDGG